MRIVSLLPAATEMLCAIGAADRLVGVSHECDWPPGVETLPRLTRSHLRGDGDSADIHQQVASEPAVAGALYAVDFKALAALRPDIIVTQDLCEVCAVSRRQVHDAVQRQASGPGKTPPRIINLAPRRLADIWRNIRELGDITDRTRGAGELLSRCLSRVGRVSEALTGVAGRPAVLTLEWLSPMMAGGLWMPDLIRLAGGTPLAAVAGEPARTLKQEDLEALDPAVVLIKPCGFDLARNRRESADLLSRLPSHWPAVSTGSLYLTDGSAFFNRPGPRIVDGVEMLAACTHPARFEALQERHADHLEILI